MQESNDLSSCPSFNTYYCDRLADIAAKVTEEFPFDDSQLNEDDATLVHDDNDDFEFSMVRVDPDDSAGEIIYENGQFGPIFPIFDRDLLEDRKPNDDISDIRIPLKKLFLEDREPPSSSSSEADELESVAPGTYCVWRPKAVEPSPSRCNKSRSTGSTSKRWRFRDLLRRSNSDGKDSFVFLTPKNRELKAEDSKERRKSVDAGKLAGKVNTKVTGERASASAHEAFYVRNRAMKEGDKRKSYLPYKQDLVGFFANVNGLGSLGPSGKTFPPF
ncbi:hypothetical protein LguiA_017076 [Lonicera macranthoides]